MKLNRAFKRKFSYNVGEKLNSMDKLKTVTVEQHKTVVPQITLKQVGWLDLNKVR